MISELSRIILKIQPLSLKLSEKLELYKQFLALLQEKDYVNLNKKINLVKIRPIEKPNIFIKIAEQLKYYYEKVNIKIEGVIMNNLI